VKKKNFLYIHKSLSYFSLLQDISQQPISVVDLGKSVNQVKPLYNRYKICIFLNFSLGEGVLQPGSPPPPSHFPLHVLIKSFLFISDGFIRVLIFL